MQVRLSRYALAMVCCFAVGCSVPGDSDDDAPTAAAAEPAAQAKVNADAQTLADFNKRIEAYMELHKKLAKDVPPLKETKDPAAIRASQEGLAEKIRAARKTAKQGDIFSPEIRTQLRRLMYPETKGPDGPETKAAMKEEGNELKNVVLKVNARYPDDAPLMTVPPNILAALPKLPEVLEYRFVNRNMILLDTHANLIVDYVPNAIQ